MLVRAETQPKEGFALTTELDAALSDADA